jgi:membrane protease YdiL (CAAX protease family)
MALSALSIQTLAARTAWPRLLVERFPSRLHRRVALALLALTLAVTSFVPPLSWQEIDPHAELEDLSFRGLFAGHAILVAFLAAWWQLSGRPSLRSFLCLDFDEPAQALRLGATMGGIGWALTMTVMAVVGTLAWSFEPARIAGGGEIPPLVREIVELSLLERLLLVLSAGVVEEAFFRAFLQTRTGLALSSLLFTASHASYGLPLMLAGVLTVSLVLGLLFQTRRNLLPCMIAHAVFDAIQLFLILPAVVAGS